MLLLEDGCDAYPELVEEVVWAPSLKESQMFDVDEMFTFVTIASSNRGLNLGIWGFSLCFDQFVEIHIYCSKFSCFRALGYHQRKPKRFA